MTLNPRRHARIGGFVAAIALATLGVVPIAAAADVVLSGEALPTKVTSYGAIVAWDSARDLGGGLERTRGIRVRMGSVSADLPVADGAQYVDLGLVRERSANELD